MTSFASKQLQSLTMILDLFGVTELCIISQHPFNNQISPFPLNHYSLDRFQWGLICFLLPFSGHELGGGHLQSTASAIQASPLPYLTQRNSSDVTLFQTLSITICIWCYHFPFGYPLNLMNNLQTLHTLQYAAYIPHYPHKTWQPKRQPQNFPLPDIIPLTLF